MFQFKLLLNTRLRSSEIFFVGLQVALIRIFERCRERGHDLAAVAKVSADLSPFLCFANGLKSTADLYGLLQLVQVQRALIYTG
jgi:hypothetical protein